MSVIGCTRNYGIPFIVGDILLSDMSKTRSIQLPTNTLDINDYAEFTDGAPIGFSQKIYIIRPNLCIALAGLVSQMKDFLSSLISFSNIHSNTVADQKFIADFLKYFNCDENYSESAFIMLLLHNITPDAGDVFQLNYPKGIWKQIDSEIFEKCIACGTGANNLLHRASQKSKFESSHPRGDPHQAIQANLGLFARLLAEEKVTLNSAVKCWGAGFETILFNGKSFIKFPEIAYIIWVGHFLQDGKLKNVNPYSIMYYKYYDDVLLITSVEIMPGNIKLIDNMVVFTSHNIQVTPFEVPRIDVPLNLSNYKRPDDLSFRTNRIVIGYAFTTPHDVASPAYYNETSGIEVNFQQPENLVEIKIHFDIHHRMIVEGEQVFNTLVF